MLAQMATQVVEKKIGDRRGRRVRAGERERERERETLRGGKEKGGNGCVEWGEMREAR